MRVVEPHQFKLHQKKRRSKGPLLVILVLVILAGAGAGGFFYWHNKTGASKKTPAKSQGSSESTPQVQAATVDYSKMTLKTFTGNEFRDLYRSIMPAYPNTQEFTTLPSITGNTEADNHIRKLAEARGFQLTRIPITALVKLNEPMVSGETDDLLQAPAYEAWQQIKADAKKDNIPLTLMSAFRSPEFQRTLFMQRLLARGVSMQQIIDGRADSQIQANFDVTAVPGYSRHHTGYTVDFWCQDGSGNFGNSTCFRWLNANNYQHAKEAGWIPSYPDGADEQGPEPEPWEYVWVGKAMLYQ